jgi:hypothetical protein
VLELSRSNAAILLCLGPRDALDSLPSVEGAVAFRVAADELMLVSLTGPLDPDPLITRLAAVGGVVVDQSDAYASWTLAGDAEEAFARLSAIELPRDRPAFVQGAVGGIPAKAIVEEERIHLLVSSALAHHLRDRIGAACAELLGGPARESTSIRRGGASSAPTHPAS